VTSLLPEVARDLGLFVNTRLQMNTTGAYQGAQGPVCSPDGGAGDGGEDLCDGYSGSIRRLAKIIAIQTRMRHGKGSFNSWCRIRSKRMKMKRQWVARFTLGGGTKEVIMSYVIPTLVDMASSVLLESPYLQSYSSPLRSLSSSSQAYILSIASLPAHYAASASAPSNTIDIFDKSTLQRIQTLPGHGVATTSLHSVENVAGIHNVSLMSSGKDGSVKVWDERSNSHSIKSAWIRISRYQSLTTQKT
jgi:hypothetical protein